MEFYKTKMGHAFFERQVPRIATALETIGEQLTQSNSLKERELALKERELAILERDREEYQEFVEEINNSQDESDASKKYELNFYERSGTSDPIDVIETVQEVLCNETGTTIPLEEIKEGAIFTNNDGEIITVTSYNSHDENEKDDVE